MDGSCVRGSIYLPNPGCIENGTEFCVKRSLHMSASDLI